MAQVTTTFLGTETESREQRINRIQTNRLRLIGVLTVFSLIEWATICMGYYTDVPLFFVIVSAACVLINPCLIWWLGGLWWDQHKREKEIERQNMKGGML